MSEFEDDDRTIALRSDVLNTSFSVPLEWRPFYAKKYLNPKRKYTEVVAISGNRKQCGCENPRCKTTASSWKCGFCNVSMRSSCVHSSTESTEGVCRSCYLQNYKDSVESVDDSESSVCDPSQGTANSPDIGKRKAIRSTAARRMEKVANMRSNKDREGNTPIPIGGVVTIHIPSVDRGHTDARRLPGVVVGN